MITPSLNSRTLSCATPTDPRKKNSSDGLLVPISDDDLSSWEGEEGEDNDDDSEEEEDECNKSTVESKKKTRQNKKADANTGDASASEKQRGGAKGKQTNRTPRKALAGKKANEASNKGNKEEKTTEKRKRKNKNDVNETAEEEPPKKKPRAPIIKKPTTIRKQLLAQREKLEQKLTENQKNLSAIELIIASTEECQQEQTQTGDATHVQVEETKTQETLSV